METSRDRLLRGEKIGRTEAERWQETRNKIKARHVEIEARERLSSLPPGSLETEPAPMLTGKPGSR